MLLVALTSMRERDDDAQEHESFGNMKNLSKYNLLSYESNKVCKRTK